MATLLQRIAWVCVATLPWASAAQAQLPQRDLTIEIRQTEEGPAEGQRYSAGADDPAQQWEPQLLQVRNGERATLRLLDALPMQWVQSIGAEASQGAGKGGKVTSVSNALTWFDAGQSVSVRPLWTGGNRPAQLEVEVQKAAVADRVGADLPTQSRSTVSTTVTVALGQWVTIAASGALPQNGSYSNTTRQQARRLLQVRVLVP